MLELMAIVGGFILLSCLPYEVNKVCGGWARNRGQTEKSSRRLRKEPEVDHVDKRDSWVASESRWLRAHPEEWGLRLLGAAIRFGVATVAFHQRGKPSSLRSG